MSRGLDRTSGISDRGVVSHPLQMSAAGKHHITPATRYTLDRTNFTKKVAGAVQALTYNAAPHSIAPLALSLREHTS